MKIIFNSTVLSNLGVKEQISPSIQEFMSRLWEANKSLNLISRKMTEEELFENHIVDAYLPLSNFPENVKKVADFGAGGGIPGILYALQFPNIKFVLFEKSSKKQEFLRQCQQILTPNIEIRSEINPGNLNGVELVMARAFKPLDVILEMSQGYYQSGGSYFLFKGKKEKIDEEFELARKKYKNLHIEKIELISPVLEVERYLVLINRIDETPN